MNLKTIIACHTRIPGSAAQSLARAGRPAASIMTSQNDLTFITLIWLTHFYIPMLPLSTSNPFRFQMRRITLCKQCNQGFLLKSFLLMYPSRVSELACSLGNPDLMPGRWNWGCCCYCTQSYYYSVFGIECNSWIANSLASCYSIQGSCLLWLSWRCFFLL